MDTERIGGAWLCLLRVFVLFIGLGVLGVEPALCEPLRVTNSLGMEFVQIPNGAFQMGSPLQEPLRDKGETLHGVTLNRSFFMQTTEVTVGQWRKIMGRRMLGAHPGPDHLPVTRVSWFDCAEFIGKLNGRGEGLYRLPTEAEWEYACRAGKQTPFPWGTQIDCTRARFGRDPKGAGECREFHGQKGQVSDGPLAVKSYEPNGWGLYDMNGNVWEWCWDWFDEYGRAAAVDPVGPESGTMKVRRGGGWSSEGKRLRCANRAYAHPASRFRNTGFRIVREDGPAK